MTRRHLFAAGVALAVALAQSEPKPEKPDLPYLKHATNLIATEAVAAKQEKHGNDTRYIIAGANSAARTPLAAKARSVMAVSHTGEKQGWKKKRSPFS